MVSRLTERDRIFAAKVRKIRESKSKSRREIAEKMGISQQQLSKYENCQDRISVGKLIDLSEVLEVSFLALVPEEFFQLVPIDRLGFRLWNNLKYKKKKVIIQIMEEI